MNVLLVEDDPLVREVLVEGLADAGLLVTHAETAEDVLSLADGLPGPAVLVTDINLPGSDGFALAAAARQRWAGLRVVFISGRPMNLDGNLLDPRDVFLAKPFTAALLAEVIVRLGEREAVTAEALPEDGLRPAG